MNETGANNIEVDQVRLFERLDNIAKKQDEFSNDFRDFQREIREGYVRKDELSNIVNDRNAKIHGLDLRIKEYSDILSGVNDQVKMLNNDLIIRNNSTGHKIGNALSSTSVKFISGAILLVIILAMVSEMQQTQQTLKDILKVQTVDSSDVTNLTKEVK